MSACVVSDQFCSAPANLEGARARAKCFACGEAVCGECSSRRNYLNYGVRRLCNTCQVTHDGGEAVVLRRMFKQAGY